MNEKSQGKKERLYSEDKRRSKALAITKEVIGQLKSTVKEKGNREGGSLQLQPQVGGGEGRKGSQRHKDRISQMFLATE
jgi:hypothetical protein